MELSMREQMIENTLNQTMEQLQDDIASEIADMRLCDDGGWHDYSTKYLSHLFVKFALHANEDW